VAFGTAAGLAAAALVLAVVVARPAVASGARRFRSPWSRTGLVSRPGFPDDASAGAGSVYLSDPLKLEQLLTG
jgi:hypothetical protein